MVKQLRTAVLMLLTLTIVTGIAYPLAITLVSQVIFPVQANGSLITKGNPVIGSKLIGQNMNGDPSYFWSRPSAISYNPLPSSGSNLGPISAKLQESVAQRETEFRTANNVPANVAVPSEMLFASGSGLDPHISPEAARLQIERIAVARGLPSQQVKALVDQFIEAPQLGFLGEPRVNVLLLNLALDTLQS